MMNIIIHVTVSHNLNVSTVVRSVNHCQLYMFMREILSVYGYVESMAGIEWLTLLSILDIPVC